MGRIDIAYLTKKYRDLGIDQQIDNKLFKVSLFLIDTTFNNGSNIQIHSRTQRMRNNLRLFMH